MAAMEGQDGQLNDVKQDDEEHDVCVVAVRGETK